jgi:hypothetical protein
MGPMLMNWALCLHVLSVCVFLPGFATSYWLQAGGFHYGLWYLCFTGSSSSSSCYSLTNLSTKGTVKQVNQSLIR